MNTVNVSGLLLQESTLCFASFVSPTLLLSFFVYFKSVLPFYSCPFAHMHVSCLGVSAGALHASSRDDATASAPTGHRAVVPDADARWCQRRDSGRERFNERLRGGGLRRAAHRQVCRENIAAHGVMLRQLSSPRAETIFRYSLGCLLGSAL